VFGAAGLVVTRRNSPPLSGALAKSASGALEVVPIALVQNLARALHDLKGQGCICLGLDDDAPNRLEDEDMSGAIALVLGAEGKGLRQLTRESCDRLCRIETDGPLRTLNVSNAAAVALHLATMSRRRARA
jgi:23S rRNA (guanosine2251-2'-O)-methyltransferase